MNNFLDPVEFSMASKGLRFANYLIDVILFRILSYGIGYALGMFLINTSIMDNQIVFTLFVILFELVLFVFYFALQEFLMKGRTIGKFITGTKVVLIDGNDPEFNAYLIRSVSRLVPFEQFSFFGEIGWHDAWSKTRVVNVREFQENRYKFNSIDQIGINS